MDPNDQQQRLMQGILAFQRARMNQAAMSSGSHRSDVPAQQQRAPTALQVMRNPAQGSASLYPPDMIQLIQQRLLQEQLIQQRQQAMHEQSLRLLLHPEPSIDHQHLITALHQSHRLLNQGHPQQLDVSEESLLQRRRSENALRFSPRRSNNNTEENKVVAPQEARKEGRQESGGSAEGNEGESDEEESADVNQDRFPFKLHQMMVDVEKEGKEDIVSFLEDENTFRIHEPEKFAELIMPRYFSTSRLSSFQRQLNLYGFVRISEGPMKGAYRHKHFLKGKPTSCKYIKRKMASSSSLSSSAKSSRSRLHGQSETPTSSVSSLGNFQFPLAMQGAPMPPLDRHSLLSLLMIQRQRQHEQEELIRALLERQLQESNRG